MIPLKPISGKENNLRWQIRFEPNCKFLELETTGTANYYDVVTLNKILFNEASKCNTHLILMDYQTTDIQLNVDEVCVLSNRVHPLTHFATNKIALLVKEQATKNLALKLLQAILKNSMTGFIITSQRSDAEAWLLDSNYIDRIVFGLS